MKSDSGHPLTLTGETVSFEWRVEELPTHNARTGLKECRVHERYIGNDVPDPQVFGPMPCVVTENFVRIRRAQAHQMMTEAGGIKLIRN